MPNLSRGTAILLIAIVLNYTARQIHALCIQGTVANPSDDDFGSLQVAAYARDGKLETSASVTANATFNLFLKPGGATPYILHLLGSIQNQYHPIILYVDPLRVLFSKVRYSPLQRLNLTTVGAEDMNTAVHFEPSAPTLHALKRKQRRFSVRTLWAYRLQALMLAGAVFIIWFPKFIRDLPKEVREELLGEKEDEMGDPNALFKSLFGIQDDSNQQATKSKAA
ncbi:unnamed protein product [Agarophyton chilense]